jgi:peptidoglycan/xylan/chitin deacetylase (PgdA/CDA1 family)
MQGPNTFAFAIDDGIPRLAQEVLHIFREEEIKVTFFPVGKGLADEETILTNVYNKALSLGPEIGLHSWSHPK